MLQRKQDVNAGWGLTLLERRWKWVVVAAWLLFCAWFIYSRWADIRFFNLGDTDDNMRMMQVRGLLHGQGWFDLRDYRMNPPFGANIHWSRLVDLPIAGLILLLRPLLGGPGAERIAVGIAPLLPYLLLLFSLALTARRLIHPSPIRSPCSASVLRRLDQQHVHAGADRPSRLAAGLARLRIASLADPKRARGGLVLGISTALVARHRPGDDHLPRAGGRRDGAVLGRRPRRARRGSPPMRCRWLRRRPSASSPSRHTRIGARCAMHCRRSGCRMR